MRHFLKEGDFCHTSLFLSIEHFSVELHDRRIVLIYPLDVTSLIFTKQLRNRFGDYPKLYLVMRGGDI